jgi:mRNA interferase RelE/StbE
MESYRVLLKKTVYKDLRNINPMYVQRIIDRIRELSANPFPRDSEKLTESENFYRLRVGDYRICIRLIIKTKQL